MDELIGRFGVTLWKSSHADPEASPVRVRVGAVELRDSAHKVSGMAKGRGPTAISRRIATQSQQVADSVGGVSLQDVVDIALFVAHAGQVWNRIELATILQPNHQIMRAGPC
jgi:hypothetical protein